MTDQKILQILHGLYQIADAGEKGYATAAASVPDPALKILFKLYAQQRLDFKNELNAELERLDDPVRPRASIPGAIHRGRVAIFAGLANPEDQPRVILKETTIGEHAAVRAYQSGLTRLAAQNTPQPTLDLVERQAIEVERAAEQVQCLRDDVASREAMHLIESEQEINQAVQDLVSGGFARDEIETIDLNDRVLYQGRGATLGETVLSGAFGGALWGGLMGLLAGFGVVQSTRPEATADIILTWLLVALGFMAIGALISAVLAFFIGIGVSGEDRYQYQAIRESARILVQTRTCGVTE